MLLEFVFYRDWPPRRATTVVSGDKVDPQVLNNAWQVNLFRSWPFQSQSPNAFHQLNEGDPTAALRALGLGAPARP